MVLVLFDWDSSKYLCDVRWFWGRLLLLLFFVVVVVYGG
jgi:hypothetical protein